MNALQAPLWITNVNNNETANDQRTIAQTIESLVMEAKKDISSVNFFFVYRAAPNPRHLVTILRTTFAIRQRIAGWTELRDFARNYLPTQGIKVEEVMKGLIE